MIRSSKARIARTLLTLAVVLLPIFSGISGGLHLLLVRHVVCREHGELIHADEVCDGPSASPLASTSAVESSTPTLTGEKPRGVEKDEHCLIGVLTRTSFVSWRASEGQSFFLRECTARVPRDRIAPAASIEQILLAPKQSPPV